jgi:hypothetical protein
MLMMDEGKKLPLKVGNDIVGTATVLPNREIEVVFDTSPIGRSFYDLLVADTFEYLSIDARLRPELPETKEINNG